MARLLKVAATMSRSPSPSRSKTRSFSGRREGSSRFARRSRLRHPRRTETESIPARSKSQVDRSVRRVTSAGRPLLSSHRRRREVGLKRRIAAAAPAKRIAIAATTVGRKRRLSEAALPLRKYSPPPAAATRAAANAAAVATPAAPARLDVSLRRNHRARLQVCDRRSSHPPRQGQVENAAPTTRRRAKAHHPQFQAHRQEENEREGGCREMSDAGRFPPCRIDGVGVGPSNAPAKARARPLQNSTISILEGRAEKRAKNNPENDPQVNAKLPVVAARVQADPVAM